MKLVVIPCREMDSGGEALPQFYFGCEAKFLRPVGPMVCGYFMYRYTGEDEQTLANRARASLPEFAFNVRTVVYQVGDANTFASAVLVIVVRE